MDTLKRQRLMVEFQEIDATMKYCDNLPNTVASLEAKVRRRALLIAVQYGGDRRYTRDQFLHMLDSPSDVLKVYHMLLTRGYEVHNIRILAEGISKDPSTHPTKQNIMDSLEWLFCSAEPGDCRYLHFSGHGYAYEVEEGEGKEARIAPVPPTLVEHDSVPSTYFEGSSSMRFKSGAKFYHEAFLAGWKCPTWPELLEMQVEGSIMLDAYNRVNDEELNTMIAKLPKGCLLTISLDCFHGGKIFDINRLPTGPIYRGEADQLEDNQPTTCPLEKYSNTSPHNLFVPPAFYLHSECNPDPKVAMERVQGLSPLHDIKATVLVWSGYSTSHSQTGVFTSAFTSAVQDLDGNISHHELFQETRRRVSEITGGKGGDPIIPLFTSWDENNEQADVSIPEAFTI